jgi:hypothetical protein
MKRRRCLRFNLRTLALGVLLVGRGIGLLRRWAVGARITVLAGLFSQ